MRVQGLHRFTCCSFTHAFLHIDSLSGSALINNHYRSEWTVAKKKFSYYSINHNEQTCLLLELHIQYVCFALITIIL